MNFDHRARMDILDTLLGIGIALVVVGLFMAFGSDVIDDISGDFVDNTAGCNATAKTSCGTNYNATQDSLSGMSKLAAKLPSIGSIGGIIVIIGLLLSAFAVGGRRFA